MSIFVFVLDKQKRPLMPCSARRARKLLNAGRARIAKLYPFTIRLIDRTMDKSILQPLILKTDPGSHKTGIALVREDKNRIHHALFLACLTHRGVVIRDALKARSAFRRRRRSANLRYRQRRYFNRKREKGTLTPSLRHIVETTMTWIVRLQKLAPITGISHEFVKFDTQLMDNPEISGEEYQQGTLYGYELKEYLLQKYHHRCAYCGAIGVPLNIEHVIPKARGGSNRVSNLVVACVACNQRKGVRPLEEFLRHKPDLLAEILNGLKTPRCNAGWMNSIRWILFRLMKTTKLPLQLSSGARTKFNRHRFGVKKDHWLDALCVGDCEGVRGWEKLSVLHISAKGRGRYQRTRPDKYGFPRNYSTNQKRIHGFSTGDMCAVLIPHGKKAGKHIGRIAIRHSGYLTMPKVVDGYSWKHFTLLARNDGYEYAWQKAEF